MMSDHLAGMNEKLTQQKDEIDDLKAQLVNTKSSTSKVMQGLGEGNESDMVLIG